uniref:Uncharacterized protein n=1 Tax=Trichuris muris TaxID=70415 RepID=A0A5S6R346_TRIMR
MAVSGKEEKVTQGYLGNANGRREIGGGICIEPWSRSNVRKSLRLARELPLFALGQNVVYELQYQQYPLHLACSLVS